jgi:hypothetical protein
MRARIPAGQSRCARAELSRWRHGFESRWGCHTLRCRSSGVPHLLRVQARVVAGGRRARCVPVRAGQRRRDRVGQARSDRPLATAGPNTDVIAGPLVGRTTFSRAPRCRVRSRRDRNAARSARLRFATSFCVALPNLALYGVKSPACGRRLAAPSSAGPALAHPSQLPGQSYRGGPARYALTTAIVAAHDARAVSAAIVARAGPSSATSATKVDMVAAANLPSAGAR